MKSAADTSDASQPDLYWSGHSGWAILPGLVVGGVASGVVMFAAPPLGEWVGMPEEWTVFVCFWLVLIVGLLAAVAWAYRAASFVYRLTPSNIYVDFGMLYRPVPPMPLAQVTRVECHAWALRRLFGVGSVIVRADGQTRLRMGGVFRPDRFANAIREAVAKARQG